MSHENSSLAFDETLEEYSHDFYGEHELDGTIRVHYSRAPGSQVGPQEVIRVKGSITVSF